MLTRLVFALVIPMTGFANVIYTLASPAGLTSFQYTSPDFITLPHLMLPAGLLDFCNAATSCTGVDIYDPYIFPNTSFLIVNSVVGQEAFVFSQDAFHQTGIYNATGDFGTSSGTLTVTASAVPEPSFGVLIVLALAAGIKMLKRNPSAPSLQPRE